MSFELMPHNSKRRYFHASHWDWPGFLGVIDSTGVLDPGEIHQMKFNDRFRIDAKTAKKIGIRIIKMIDEKTIDTVISKIVPVKYSDGACEALIGSLSSKGWECKSEGYVLPPAKAVKLFAKWCIQSEGFEVT